MKNKQTSYDYGDCHVCGEQMQERHIEQEFRINGKLIVIEDLPAGVCPRCGAKVVNAKNGQQLEKLLAVSTSLRPARRLTVPVISYAQKAA